MKYSALLTDLYELTMMQGYYLLGNNPQVSFDMFFAAIPSPAVILFLRVLEI